MENKVLVVFMGISIRGSGDSGARAPSSSTPADPDMADGLVDYAQFLETVRRDYDRAEEMYKRAVEADPKYAWGLRKYAHFLQYVRHNYDRAEEMYQRFVEADHGRLFRGWS